MLVFIFRYPINKSFKWLWPRSNFILVEMQSRSTDYVIVVKVVLADT